MDPRKNPFAPGAGTPPPELAGRDEVRQSASISLDRFAGGLAARGMVLYGLRGVGKTVLLNRIRLDAAAAGATTVAIESPEGRSLPSAMLPALRTTLLRLSRRQATAELAGRALGVLASFVKAFKVRYDDLEMSIDVAPEAGTADSGDFDSDLSELLRVIGQTIQPSGGVIALFIDELQYVPEDQLGALITSLHHCNQSQLPVTLMAAGLPQLLGQMGKAKSYAERLFEFIPIGALPREDAAAAIVNPIRDQAAGIEPEAVQSIVDSTGGYPYFLQEWGKTSWEIAESSPITLQDAKQADVVAISGLDASFFRVRFDRLTPSEKRYMRAMAELGAGPHRSGDVAAILGRKVTSLAPTRSSLIKKGMAYSPSHGDVAFTVPLFDGFMKRVMELTDN